MQSKLKDLPYEAIMGTVDRLRKEFFARPWPTHAPTIEPSIPTDELRVRLREQGYEGVYLSYRYEGQAVDLRKPVYDFESETPMEIHVRQHEDGRFIGHLEASRYEEKSAHINEKGFEWLSKDELEGIVRSQ